MRPQHLASCFSPPSFINGAFWFKSIANGPDKRDCRWHHEHNTVIYITLTSVTSKIQDLIEDFGNIEDIEHVDSQINDIIKKIPKEQQKEATTLKEKWKQTAIDTRELKEEVNRTKRTKDRQYYSECRSYQYIQPLIGGEDTSGILSPNTNYILRMFFADDSLDIKKKYVAFSEDIPSNISQIQKQVDVISRLSEVRN